MNYLSSDEAGSGCLGTSRDEIPINIPLDGESICLIDMGEVDSKTLEPGAVTPKRVASTTSTIVVLSVLGAPRQTGTVGHH